MSTLQAANIWFESTSNTGMKYNGGNSFSFFAGGVESIRVSNTASVAISAPIILAHDLRETKSAAIASAGTTDIWTPADGNYVHITGTTTITSLGTAHQAGEERTVVFDGILTLTHNGTTLVLPGAANITTAVGDVMIVRADTAANMKVVVYTSTGAVSIATLVGDSGSGGTKGLVPAPAAGDAAANKYLKANGTWSTVLAPGPHVYIEDQKTSGTAGQAIASNTWVTRNLNTLVFDPLGLCTVSSNQFALLAGTYVISWSAPNSGTAVGPNPHKTKLYSITASADVAQGSSEYQDVVSSGPVQTRSHGTVRLTIAATTTYEIRHISTAQATSGGNASSNGIEVYTQVTITKVG